MLLFKPLNKIFDSRKNLKIYLGGTNIYNKYIKKGDILFIN